MRPWTRGLLNTTPWSSGPLGSRADWPVELEAAARLVVDAAISMALAVGSDLVLLYNDAYAALIGGKHPSAWGRSAREVFPENWDLPGHGDRVEHVLRTGEPLVDSETLLPVHRRGPHLPPEQVYFSRAYSPICDRSGRVLAVLTVVVEASAPARAVREVSELATRLTSAASVDDVTREALAFAIESAGADGARVVLLEGTALRISRRAAVDEQDESSRRLPLLWSRLSAETRLPSVRVAREGRPLWLFGPELDDFPALAAEPLPAPLHTVATVPLSTSELLGALSLGWERPRPLSGGERAALLTVASLVGQALARA